VFSLESALRCAEEFKKQYNRLDLLVLNAGIMMCPWTLSKDVVFLTLPHTYYSVGRAMSCSLQRITLVTLPLHTRYAVMAVLGLRGGLMC
jgi:hypothetical protein